ncbi:ribonuclease T [Pseudooceanicola sediminis]|uniref:Ribonuclease T n=2 Tax=Pseudooceanicola sediminis TaxID=2211117 RepID=A0A399J3X8_9RHOB|nr:ribonuclease T2 [Puniceibacterium sp. HSS470]RII37666.1 ribonuclease T [Pseudooceanicola sediminis]|tara:strand:- start:9342 stop:9998 length:657 start_codon:yes stop_codon:yes gene_type:complete
MTLARDLALLLSAALSLAPAARAGDVAGRFDYYVLSLSWSPGWCAAQGRASGSAQCAPGKAFGWVLHGLWPQNEVGYPADCASPLPDPSRAETAAMADIMGTGSLAWHEWQKHGRCSGLSAQAYFALSRRAYDSVTRPALLRAVPRDLRLPASTIEAAFLEENPQLEADGLTITCKAGRIQEARICLTKWLDPRPCAPDTRRDCRATDALFHSLGGSD